MRVTSQEASQLGSASAEGQWGPAALVSRATSSYCGERVQIQANKWSMTCCAMPRSFASPADALPLPLPAASWLGATWPASAAAAAQTEAVPNIQALEQVCSSRLLDGPTAAALTRAVYTTVVSQQASGRPPDYSAYVCPL